MGEPVPAAGSCPRTLTVDSRKNDSRRVNLFPAYTGDTNTAPGSWDALTLRP